MKKIKSIKTNSNMWFNLEPGVEIMTNVGVKTCTRFYFNGFHKTKIIFVEDGTVIETTDNHKLMINGEWTRADNIREGDVFNNSMLVMAVEEGSVKPTMDMEVPDVHHYLLPNGIMSHNSSFILGQVSPSIEPLNSNYFVKDLAKGKFTYRNPYLKSLLETRNMDNAEVWKSILISGGSVQHLDGLTQAEKDVFKTFGEISQLEIVQQAAQRQRYIDQSQSLNLMIHPKTPMKDVNTLMIEAWKLGVKTLYYQRSTNPAQELARNILTCTSCEI
jgi:ribonucleotide reductase alpha subunit